MPLINHHDEETPAMFHTVAPVWPGVYVTVSPSATGLGSHIRWWDHPPPESHKVEPMQVRGVAADSSLFRSVFGGSQSSLTSLTSSGSSFSDVDADVDFSDYVASESSFTSVDSDIPFVPPPPPRRARRGRSLIGTPRTTPLRKVRSFLVKPRAPTKGRQPLVRSNARHGTLTDAVGNVNVNVAGPSTRRMVVAPSNQQPSNTIDFDEIFSNELQNLLEEKERVDNFFKELDDRSTDDGMVEAENALVIRDATSAPRKLGPCGTQLVGSGDEFDARGANDAEYPQAWVEHRSTALHPVPTQPAIL